MTVMQTYRQQTEKKNTTQNIKHKTYTEKFGRKQNKKRREKLIKS